MPSKGCRNTKEVRVLERTEDYCYFSVPADVRVNLKTGEIERKHLNGKEKGTFGVAPLHPSNKSGSLRFRSAGGRESYSAARIILAAYRVSPADNDHSTICFKDGNRSNISIDNLYFGTGPESRGLEVDNEWYENMCKLIPDPSKRTVKNPEYMKLYNQKKGSDGLNHTERYYKRLRERLSNS
jgi:hypothetical protein